MIEIVGSENLQEKELKWRSLPKNVRQIGESKEGQKIYMEDYVVTYLTKLSKPDQVYARGAILFGKSYQTEEGPAIFIDGAVEAQNLELDMDETIFDEIIWEELIRKGKRYFPEKEVAGWFLSRMGFSVEVNQKIINTHIRNFPGGQKVLYMIDSLEKEDAMYLWENGQMKRQSGYYIYYEKNSAMQEYMLEGREEKKKEPEESGSKGEIRRDRKIVNTYRKMSRYRRDNKKQESNIRLIKAACGLLILVMGIGIAGRLGKEVAGNRVGEQMLAVFHQIKQAADLDSSTKVQEDTKKGDALKMDNDEQAESMGKTELEDEMQTTSTENSETINGQGTDDSETTKKEETDSEGSGMENTALEIETIAPGYPLYYTVKKGDTLAEISRKMFATDRYASQIAAANDISNVDEIYVGQKILIPSVR